jgi:hypothetical protein
MISGPSYEWIIFRIISLRYSTPAESPRLRSEIMDTWESFFREKSRRRSRRLTPEKAIKVAIFTALLCCIVTVVYMVMAGVPR